MKRNEIVQKLRDTLDQVSKCPVPSHYEEDTTAQD